MQPLDKETSRERLRDSLISNYHSLSDILKGAALGVAALATLRVFDQLTLLIFSMWVAGLVQTIVTHAAWRRGVLMTVDRTTSWDVVLPLSVGTVEIIYFAMLATWSEGQLKLFLPGMIFLHGALASLLIWNRIAVTTESDYASDLQIIGQEYVSWMKRDRILASLISGSAAITMWALFWLGAPDWALSASFFAFSAVVVKPIIGFQAERIKISDSAWQ